MHALALLAGRVARASVLGSGPPPGPCGQACAKGQGAPHSEIRRFKTARRFRDGFTFARCACTGARCAPLVGVASSAPPPSLAFLASLLSRRLFRGAACVGGWRMPHHIRFSASGSQAAFCAHLRSGVGARSEESQSSRSPDRFWLVPSCTSRRRKVADPTCCGRSVALLYRSRRGAARHTP